MTQDDKNNPMAINFIQHQVWKNHPQHLHVTLLHQKIDKVSLVEHYANPVIHPEMGERITSYETLVDDPLTKEIWTNTMATELGNIEPGHKATNTLGINTVFFLDHNAINNIPTDGKITYAHIIMEYRPQELDPNRVSITVGGNFIEYPHTTQTADLVIAKILWNSVVCTPHAKYVSTYAKRFYLNTPMGQIELQMPIKLISQSLIYEYDP